MEEKKKTATENRDDLRRLKRNVSLLFVLSILNNICDIYAAYRIYRLESIVSQMNQLIDGLFEITGGNIDILGRLVELIRGVLGFILF